MGSLQAAAEWEQLLGMQTWGLLIRQAGGISEAVRPKVVPRCVIHRTNAAGYAVEVESSRARKGGANRRTKCIDESAARCAREIAPAARSVWQLRVHRRRPSSCVVYWAAPCAALFRTGRSRHPAGPLVATHFFR